MIYIIIKVITWVTYQIYFRRFFLNGRSRLPAQEPTVVAANHQSAFIEPMMVGTYTRKPLHFMTRGDVFVKKYMWFFKATNQIPIFRFKDGFEGIRKNAASLERCTEVLNEDGRILIFCQKGMAWEKRIMAVQKGAVRMATDTLEKYPDKDIYIVPTGINYTNHTKFRSDVMVKYGEPIRVKDYVDKYPENIRRAVTEMSRNIAAQQKNLIVNIPDPADDDRVNLLLEMVRNRFVFSLLPMIRTTDKQLMAEINAAKSFQSQKESLVERLDSYDGLLKKHKLSDRLFAASTNIFFILLWIILLPLGLLGVVLNILPLYIAQRIALATTSGPEFYSSVRSAAGGFIYFAYFLLLAILLAIFIPERALLILATIIVSGITTLFIYDFWPNIRSVFRSILVNRKELKRMKNLRNEILSDI